MAYITQKALDRLKAMHKQATMACDSNTDAQAIETRALYPDWEKDIEIGETLEEGSRVNYKDALYKVTQTHQKQKTKKPKNTTSLYMEILKSE